MRNGSAARTRLGVALIVAIAGWALIQSYARLALAPITPDEPVYASAGWRYLHWWAAGSSGNAASNFEHPPLAKMLFGLGETVVGHPSVVAARVVATSCTFITGVVLMLWLRRTVGVLAGAVAGAVFVLVPTPIEPHVTSFGRSAMLEPVAVLFAVASVVAAWHWLASSRGHRCWRWAAVTGASVGLAAASKENGFLPAVGPIAVGIWLGMRTGRPRSTLAMQLLLSIAAALLTFIACYLPFGKPFVRVGFLVKFQLDQRTQGHLVGFAGQVSARPPWWTNAWFMWHSLGSTVVLAVGALCMVAVTVRRDRLVAWLVASAAAPFLFHSFVAGNALPFYWVMWWWPIVALAGIGSGELVGRAGRSGIGATVCAVCVAILGFAAARQTITVLREPTVGGAAVAQARHDHGLSGAILTTGVYQHEVEAYVDPRLVVTDPRRQLATVDTIVVGRPACRSVPDPFVVATVDLNLRDRRIRTVHTDRLVTVYAVDRPLEVPSNALVQAMPRRALSDGC